jgi:hypothetical protein
MKNNLINIKIEFEDQPVMASKLAAKSPAEFDAMIDDLKTKIFGRRR